MKMTIEEVGEGTKDTVVFNWYPCIANGWI